MPAGLDALYRDRVDLADLVGVLLEDDVALRLPETLDDHLLGRLRRDASRAVGKCPGRDVVAKIGDGADLLGVGQSHFRQRVFNLLDDGLYYGDVHVAGVRVELHGYVLTRRDAVAPVGRRERGLDCRKDDVLRKITLGGKLREGDDKVALHIYHLASIVFGIRLVAKKVGQAHFLSLTDNDVHSLPEYTTFPSSPQAGREANGSKSSPAGLTRIATKIAALPPQPSFPRTRESSPKPSATRGRRRQPHFHVWWRR